MADLPRRIQLSRAKGWRKPPGAVVVARPTKWGNPFTVSAAVEAGIRPDRAHGFCVRCFEYWLRGDRQHWMGPESDAAAARILDALPDVRGRDLACWCPLDSPCHADVLLDMANA